MLTVRTFLTSKEGEPREDCEDSIHPAPGGAAGDGSCCAFAVADGVTTSFCGGQWARQLTARFAESPAEVFELPWADWLATPQEQWQTTVRERAASGSASFYFCNDVLSRRPAAATFVGLLLDAPAGDETVPWRALVLGDSCLFILGKDGPRSLALTKADEFSNIVSAAESYAADQPFSPQLFGSAPHGSEPPLGEGDTVLLATDALSKWLLLRAEAGQPVWGTILGLAGQEEFETLVGQARREALHPLENDDVTLAILTFGPPHAIYSAARFEPQPRPDPPPRLAPWQPPPVSSPAHPVRTPSAETQSGRLPFRAGSVSRSVWLGTVVGSVILALAAALIWQTVRRQRQDEKSAALAVRVASETAEATRLRELLGQAQADTGEVKKKLARVQAELGENGEGLRRLSRELEVREQECAARRRELEASKNDLASHRKESDTRRADLEKARNQAEQACAESERNAGIARQALQQAQAQIKSLEDERQELKKNLADREQELKVLREHPEPTPEPLSPANPPVDPPKTVRLARPDWSTGVPPVRADSASRLSAHETAGWKPVVHDRQDAYPPAILIVLTGPP